MKLAIMQPYFFPYIGYFDLISKVDLFVIYDTAQFPQQGWVNRNRILHDSKGWQYLTVPLERASFVDSFRTKIKDLRISRTDHWECSVKKKIGVYRDLAPHYNDVMEMFESVIDAGDESILSLDLRGLRAVADVLGISCQFHLASCEQFGFGQNEDAANKILRMSEHFGATEYWNLPGGRDLYDPESFDAHGIELKFLEPRAVEYPTPGFDFQPQLSILDVMMWVRIETIAEWISERSAA